MKKFGKDHFVDHLTKLGVTTGERVVCHSSLFGFGIAKSRDLLDALREVLGAEGTLIVPGYIFDNSTAFNVVTSLPTNVGALSNEVLGLPNSVRSLCPVHNHIGIGPLAHTLNKNNYFSSFGVGSDFDYFLEKDFKLLLLGCSLSQGGTFLHHLEAMANVPYRTWIKTSKTIITHGRQMHIDFAYFARRDDDWTENFDIVHKELSIAHKYIQAPMSKSYLLSLRAISKFVMNELETNPYYLVRRNTKNDTQ